MSCPLQDRAIERTASPATTTPKNREIFLQDWMKMGPPSSLFTNQSELHLPGLDIFRDTSSFATPERMPESEYYSAHNFPCKSPAETCSQTSPTVPRKIPETEELTSVLSSLEIETLPLAPVLARDRVQILSSLENDFEMELPKPISRSITHRRILCTPVESAVLRNSRFHVAETHQLFIGIGDPLELERHDLRLKRAQMPTGRVHPTPGGMDTTA